MNPHGLSGRLRPSRQHELLLRCAFGSPDTALEAWRRVASSIDFERLDAGSHALLPLVYRSLSAAAPGEPLLARLKGIYKKAWFVNQLLLDRAQLPLAALRAARVEPLLLHGAPLVAAYYLDPALRRLPRLDVAVQEEAEEAARRALARARWARHPDGASLASGRPLAFVDSGGLLLFLHRRLPDGLDVPGAADSGALEMWARALPFSVGEVQALRLDPTDELLCACAVGPNVDNVTGVQWLADAAVVIHSAGTEIDWLQFAERARARRVTARVGGALKYLSAVANAPVPRDVVALLNGERLAGREQVAHWLYSRPVGPLGGLPGTLARHVRLTADLGVGAATRRLPRFLSDTWELDSVRQLPRAVSRKALATTRLHGAR